MADNNWERPQQGPPRLFFNQKEKDFVKQVNDEIHERIIGQQILYYAIDVETTNFHPIYGEAIDKTFLPPLQCYVLVEWPGLETEVMEYADAKQQIIVHFHKRRITEDKDLFVRLGDFVSYGDSYYEIIKLHEKKQLFGDISAKFEISATCMRAREGLFDSE